MDCNAAVVLLRRPDGRLLLIKRADARGDPWSGHMALPGGHREEGEDCKQTAVRETQEEVGIVPKNLTFLGIYWPNNRRDLRVAAFQGETEMDQVKPNGEVSDYFWIDPEELEEKEDCFMYRGLRIWGMTYRILKDFLSARQRSDHHPINAVDQSSLEE